MKGEILLNDLERTIPDYFDKFVKDLENQIKDKQNEAQKYPISPYSNSNSSLDKISDAEEQNSPKRSFLDKIKIGWNGF